MASEVKLCPSCDLAVNLPLYKKGVKCSCPRCKSVLRSGRLVSLYDSAVMAIAALIFFVLSLVEPFLSLSTFGMHQEMRLISIFYVLNNNWLLLLYAFILFTFIFPLSMLLIIIWAGLFKFKVTPTLAEIYTFSYRFCMIDVFVLGVAVSLIKLTALVDVSFHSGFIISGIFSAMMIWLYTKVRPDDIWDLVKKSKEEIIAGVLGKEQSLTTCKHCSFVYNFKHNEKCPRCGHINGARHYDCMQKSVALLLAAIILYFPSNLYPIMITSYLGSDTGSNILEGVITLWQMDSYFVAIVIFLASICIPVLKIIALIILLSIVKYKKPQHPLLLSKLFRVVAFIGKWSMIDVFVVIIMTSVVRFSGLMTIDPGFAIITFCLVVIITMFAAESFDERLIWDRVNGRS